jgi:radical SAM superfamily enzyme with C-terminal helix-hairpin-helix motif
MKVNENIEYPLLKKMLPLGSILRDVFTEIYHGKLTFGRQIGSYPLLIGIPGILELNNKLDVKVIDYGYRSITAIPYPLYVNNAKIETIEALPNIGKKRAKRIVENRPYMNKEEFIISLDDKQIAYKILDYIVI